MKSLFLRMRLTHWVGIALLLVNATLFTDNLIGSVVQYVIAAVILIHDLDEKRWGVDTLARLAAYLHNFSEKRLGVPCDVDVRYNGELVQVLGVVDEFRESIRETLGEAKQVSEENSRRAEALNASSRRLDERLRAQERLLEEVRGAAAEIGREADGLVHTAQAARDRIAEAGAAADVAHQGMASVGRATQETVSSSTALIEQLATLSHGAERIEGVLTVIGEIADQTNLLALNAAIEAARAGEQGRGFAVVADEVRNLSQRTQQSLAEVKEIVHGITSAVARVDDGVHRQAEILNGLVAHTEEGGVALRRAEEGIGQVGAAVAESADAGERMSAHLDTIVDRLDRVVRHSHDSAGDVSSVLQAADEASRTAERLNGKLAEFTT